MTKKPSPAKRSKRTLPRKRGPADARARAHSDSDPGAAFCRAVELALRGGDVTAITDAQLRRVLTAVVKAYAAKAEEAEREIAPFVAGAVTPTEAVVAACAMIRAVDLNLFDVAMWFRRPIAGT